MTWFFLSKRIIPAVAVAVAAARCRLIGTSVASFKPDSDVPSPSDMSKKKFWDAFYRKHDRDAFEWLVDFDEFTAVVSIEASSSNQVPSLLLDVGCGSSTFSSRLQSTMPQPAMLICADFSRQALDILKNKHATDLPVDYVQCDGKCLPFRQGFDLAIDKGYQDSVLKATDRNLAQSAVLQSIRSTMNVLEPRGFLMQITDEEPELRLSLLDQFGPGLRVNFKQIDVQRHSVYFLYLIYKQSTTTSTTF